MRRTKGEILNDIIDELRGGPKTIEQLARSVGIGWKTAASYVEGLKGLNLVVEIGTTRGRIFALVRPRAPTLSTVPNVRAPDGVEPLDERPPEEGEVEDLGGRSPT